MRKIALVVAAAATAATAVVSFSSPALAAEEVMLNAGHSSARVEFDVIMGTDFPNARAITGGTVAAAQKRCVHLGWTAVARGQSVRDPRLIWNGFADKVCGTDTSTVVGNVQPTRISAANNQDLVIRLEDIAAPGYHGGAKYDYHNFNR